MNGLFLLLTSNFLANISTLTLAIICISLVVFLTILCSIIALKKSKYTLLKRLWVVFIFIAICLLEFWVENQIKEQSSYLILTVGSCFLGLSLCLFLPVKKEDISEEKRSLAQFLSRCAQGQIKGQAQNEKTDDLLENQREITPSNIFSSTIIKAEQSQKNNGEIDGVKKSDEIDFSHIKSILARLEYYPLKEQDKKSAKELEKAILDAEENGLDKSLKQTINDGLGALLKIMAKYAV